MYPRLYTLALLSENPDTLIPNEPYTPLIDTISLDYIAEETTDFSQLTKESFDSNRIKLFHEDAFGQYEEHSYLKEKAIEKSILEKTSPTDSWLIPAYCNGGELYIGLENAETTQQISLLIEVLEGSENDTRSADVE